MQESTPLDSPSLLKEAAVAVGETPQQLTRVGVGDHLCLIYERIEEHVAAVVPYLRQGLERGERCIYAVDEHDVDEVVRILEGHGVDVEGERARGALVFVTQREVALHGGDFSPTRMVGLIQELEHESLLEGFTGLRATGEMTWTLGSEPGLTAQWRQIGTC